MYPVKSAHNRSVLLLGAKPQIISDDDFYKNSLEDERTVFKPLAERERITLLFNSLLRAAAGRLHADYADIDHVLADDKSRRQFFKKVFWEATPERTATGLSATLNSSGAEFPRREGKAGSCAQPRGPAAR